MPVRSVSIAALSPKPLITTLAPSRAMARAMASPIPEVEPVTTAVFPFSMTFTCCFSWAPRKGFRRPNARLHQRPDYILRNNPVPCGEIVSCAFRLRRQHEVNRTAPADIIEMGIEEALRGALAALAQRQEELEVDLELAARVKGYVVHDDAMQPGAARAGEFQRPQFRDQRRIERDLVHAGHDLVRARRQLGALARIDLHNQNVRARA